MARSFRTEESYAAERITRDLLPFFLRGRGFTNVEDKRKSFGSTQSQVLYALDEGGKPVRFWVRLCWRRGRVGRHESTHFSAAQLRAKVNDGNWIGTLSKQMEAERAAGITHLLVVQKDESKIIYAAAIPISSVVPIWTAQRDISAQLIKEGKLGRRKKNHAMNGSSPTLWLQDDKAPEVANALWKYEGVRDLVNLPIVGGSREP